MKRGGNPALTGAWFSNPRAATDIVAGILRKHRGRVQPAAKELKIRRETLYKWLRDDDKPALQKEWEKIRNEFGVT